MENHLSICKSSPLAVLSAIGLGMLLAVVPAEGSSITVNAAERGIVISSGTTNGASPTNNYLAGQNGNVIVRDWFEFAIPVLTGGSLVSATVNLQESPTGHAGGSLTIALYGLAGQPAVISDVSTNNLFGFASTSAASDNTIVTITLDMAALAALTADQGGNFFVGGISSGEGIGNGNYDFGNLTTANITSITLNTVPEPGTAGLVAFLLSGLVLLARRMQ